MVFFNDTHFQNPSCILAQIVCYLQWSQKMDAFGIRQLILCLSLIQWFWTSFHFQSNYAELLMLFIMNQFQLCTENKCVSMCVWQHSHKHQSHVTRLCCLGSYSSTSVQILELHLIVWSSLPLKTGEISSFISLNGKERLKFIIL